MAYRKDLNQDIDDVKISRINAAGIINITLENLWKDAFSSMAKGNLVIWNRKLDAVWGILGGDQEENDGVDKEMDKLNMKIYETGSLNHKKVGFEKLKEDEAEKMALQYLLLNKKNLFLRRLQNKQGKGTAYQSEDTDDMD
ncbi:MAG TPA: hypothetical protein ENG87_02220 [Candidatus Pacearchaeota archaeon]|nr:hypothetical protein [Candidatus Pacearchaeota archaeon]